MNAKSKTQKAAPTHTPGRTVADLAAGLQRGDYNGTERFLAYSPERAAAPDLLAAIKALLSGIPDGLPVREATALRNQQYADARAAIAKAEGQDDR